MGRILVVDDDACNVLILATRLRSLGYEVQEATNGEEALERLERNYFDLVLSDVMMPKIDGIELTRRIKQTPELFGPPVVLITAYDEAELRTRGLEAGADDFLAKPVHPAELEVRVRGQVRLRQLQNEIRGRIGVLGASNTAPLYQQKSKILMVEDDRVLSANLRFILEGKGYEVILAHDQRSGLQHLLDSDPDMVIVDMKLPDGSGVDFIREFCKRRRADFVPTVLVMSCICDARIKLEALEAGADDYLIKPVPTEELCARIQAQLRRTSTTRELRQQVARAKQEASHDALTGLFNRRFLDQDLERRVEFSSSGLYGFSVAMIDIDHFKRINDNYGHGVGDQVLSAVANFIEETVREQDLVCRYGGEEFCVVMPATSIDEATKCMERVRVNIARLSCGSLPAQQVTISVGVAQWIPGETPSDVHFRADEALYAAKREGRNRVVTSTQLLEKAS
jgi:two-component system cell cycle response regulator